MEFESEFPWGWAHDASTAWSLRCEVREKLIEFIQKNYPEGLPKVRAEIRESALPAAAMIKQKSSNNRR